jgi:hypothetical protein
MAFTELEIAELMIMLEDSFWSQCRPPAHLSDKIREGQRITGHSIELFFLRPAFHRPGEWIEDAIAKVQYVRSRGVWRIFWKRADGKWHRYPPSPEATSLADALGVIREDTHGCFFG